MKYIVGILVVITIMHDVSIYRLNLKVHVLRKFFDEVVRQLEEYASKQTEEWYTVQDEQEYNDRWGE